MLIHFKKKNQLYPYWMLVPGLIFTFVFYIIPNLTQFVFSFTDWNMYDFFNIKFIGLENFRNMLSEQVFLLSIKNTFYFAFIDVILKTVLGFILALIISSRIKFADVYSSILFLPFTFSVMVVGGAFNAIYHPDGIINQFLRFIGLSGLAQEWLVNSKFAMNSVIAMDIWMGVGFTMLIFVAALKSVPVEIYESSKIDGANGFQNTYRITIPMIMPAVTINATLNIIGGLKVFAQVLVLTNGGPADSTQVFATLIYKNFGNGYLGYASAIGLVFTVVVVLLNTIFNTTLRKLEVEN